MKPQFLRQSSKKFQQPRRNNLFKEFKNLGWSDNIQSKTTFNFLLSASKQIHSNQILLDLGAGECRYNFFFAHCHYVSVDFGKGDKKWDFSKLDILGDITKLDFIRDNSIDFCLNTVTLEHINEPQRFFREVARILKPGGKLFLYAPFIVAEHQVPYDFFRYTSYGLRYLSEQGGLKVVSLIPSNGPLSTGISLVHYSLQIAAGRNIPVKGILLIFRILFTSLLPIFDKLEFHLQKHKFPLNWLLVAEKKGTHNKSRRYASKQEAINSIICCPSCRGKLKPLNDLILCSHCGNKFSKNGNQLNFLDIINPSKVQIRNKSIPL